MKTKSSALHAALLSLETTVAWTLFKCKSRLTRQWFVTRMLRAYAESRNLHEVAEKWDGLLQELEPKLCKALRDPAYRESFVSSFDKLRADATAKGSMAAMRTFAPGDQVCIGMFDKDGEDELWYDALLKTFYIKTSTGKVKKSAAFA